MGNPNQRIIVVENNAAGQLARLVHNYGFKTDANILKYDGRPIYPEYIIEKKHKGLAMAAVPFLFESAWSALAALLALLFALFLYWLMRQREIRK